MGWGWGDIMKQAHGKRLLCTQKCTRGGGGVGCVMIGVGVGVGSMKGVG